MCGKIKRHDLTGQRFGRLVAVEYAGNSRWRCRCDCGGETMVLTGNLTHGHTTSCGCARGPGIVGRRFGGLIVTERIGKKKFRCRCDCGKTCERSYNTLINHLSTRCNDCATAARTAAVTATFVAGAQPCKIRIDPTPTKANKSGVVGVNWDKSRGKWQASIKFQGHKFNLGRFENIQAAIDARKAAEREIFGNFIEWYNSQKLKGDEEK